MAERILVVDDETTLGANIARFLERAGHHVRTAESGSVAIRELDQRSFDLVITDLRLPDIDGLSVLDHVRAVSPETVTLIMTAYASLDSAVEALRRGAHDYIMKPLTLTDLRRKVESMAAHRRSGLENARLRRMLREESGAYAALRSSGPTLSSLCATIEALAGSTSSVLVTGESGTGKALVARAIHETSSRAVGPFLQLDVSATRDDEIDARLYGVESRGEGLSRSSEGLFRAASSGTLFLEGIGDMTLRAQARLLRALESRSIVPVGGDREVPVETRVVASSNRDLAARAREGQLRSELLYLLQVVELRVPPLRERHRDVLTLARNLVEQHARAQRKPAPSLLPEVEAALLKHSWPGNVRELSSVLERAVVLARGELIASIDLAPAGNLPDEVPPPSSLAPSSALEGAPARLEDATLAFQREHVLRALRATGGNREACARLLGLSPATFYRHLQKLELKGYRPDDEGRD